MTKTCVQLNIRIVFIIVSILLTVNSNNEKELLLGILRNIPETDFPQVSIDKQLHDCVKEAEEKSSNHSTMLLPLITETQEARNQYDQVFQKARGNQNKLQKTLEDKLLENQKLRQDLFTNDLILSKKFDCKANQMTVSDCKPFCNFPYSFDTCTDSAVKVEFVKRLIASQIGLRCFLSDRYCLKRLYKKQSDPSIPCFELHVKTD